MVLLQLILSVYSHAQSAEERAELFYKNGNYEAAIVEYNKALKGKSKTNASLYLKRGISKTRTGDYKGAKSDFDMAIKIKPGDPENYLYRGTLSRILTNDNAAINDFNKAIELNPQNHEAYLYKGDTYYDLKDYYQALNSYTSAIEVKPNYNEAYLKRAGVHYILQNYQEAVNDYSIVLEETKNSGDVYFMRGLCKSFISEKDTLGACEDFRRAKKLGTNTNIPGLNKYCNSQDFDN